jgi:hypothetical protein
VLEGEMFDEADRWQRIMDSVPLSRHRGDFSYSTEVFPLTPDVVAKGPTGNERRYGVAGLAAGAMAILLCCGLFYLGIFGRKTTAAMRNDTPLSQPF